MSLMSDLDGRQSRSLSAAPGSATSSGGSPGRLGPISGVSSTPAERLTASTSSRLENPAPVPRFKLHKRIVIELLHGLDMGLSQIRHMDVIPHTGPVGCRVVVPKDDEPLAQLEGISHDIWDEMGFRSMILS